MSNSRGRNQVNWHVIWVGYMGRYFGVKEKSAESFSFTSMMADLHQDRNIVFSYVLTQICLPWNKWLGTIDKTIGAILLNDNGCTFFLRRLHTNFSWCMYIIPNLLDVAVTFDIMTSYAVIYTRHYRYEVCLENRRVICIILCKYLNRETWKNVSHHLVHHTQPLVVEVPLWQVLNTKLE